MPDASRLRALAGRRVHLPGHFAGEVTIEGARPLGAGAELRVRLPGGELDEAVLSGGDLAALLAAGPPTPAARPPADPEQVRLLVESIRIRLAWAWDRQFAVSLSGIRTLPHQIEAVYRKMLPQPRLRFLLADDPGAGKTIMAGLLVKELKLRQAIDRCLVLVPAPLTLQWQDELLRFFGEPFQIVHAANDQQQLLNLWEREAQVIASIDYAKQDGVRERVWQQRWDLVIVDEAHKCSAYTKRSAGRGDEVERTKRYQLAERLSEQCDNLLLLTATPHHGDDDRFAHFIRLLDRDLFPEPHRFGDEAKRVRREILRLGEDCPWSLRRLKEDLKDLDGRRLFPDRHVRTVSFHLGPEEYAVYKAVTAYINEFLPRAAGRRQNSVALVRTVFQRRLASSTRAIHESLLRRRTRLTDLVDELERLPPSQRARRLAQLAGRLADTEQDEDDLDETARDALIDETTAAAELDQLRTEIAALGDVAARVGRLRDSGRDSKLIALRDCLQRAEFQDLKDGRGKLLVFTEHRDTRLGAQPDGTRLDSGFLIAPAALPEPEKPAAAPVSTSGGGDDDARYPAPGGGAGAIRERKGVTAGAEPAAQGSRDFTISFVADRNELYAAWNALANLADAAGKVSVRVQAASDKGFDAAGIENGVLEPLRELGLIDDDQA